MDRCQPDPLVLPCFLPELWLGLRSGCMTSWLWPLSRGYAWWIQDGARMQCQHLPGVVSVDPDIGIEKDSTPLIAGHQCVTFEDAVRDYDIVMHPKLPPVVTVSGLFELDGHHA